MTSQKPLATDRARNNLYIPFSRKFAEHYKKVLSLNHTVAQFTFITGEAGIGKSTTLQKEFIEPLRASHAKIYQFNFIPNDKLHNHRFIDKLLEQIDLPRISKKSELLYTSPIRSYRKIYSYGDFHDLITLLQDKSFKEKSILCFEDIHLAGKWFLKFLEALSTYKNLNINVICTSRYDRPHYNLPFKNHQKWLPVKNLTSENTYRFLKAVDSQGTTNPSLAEDIQILSGGNPFYLQELCFLNEQKKENPASASINVILNLSEGCLSIVDTRISYLNENQKQLLFVLSRIGYKAKCSNLYKILDYLEVSYKNSDIRALEALNFIYNIDDTITFRHQLIYEAIKRKLAETENKTIHKKIFFYFLKHERDNLEALVYHAAEADLNVYACHFSQKFYQKLYNESQYELALEYCDKYVDLLDICSSTRKLTERKIEAYVSLSGICLVLGENERAKRLSALLCKAVDGISLENKSYIYSALTTHYWTMGSLTNAKKYADVNTDLSRRLNDRHAEITSLCRSGNLSLELGEFETAIKICSAAKKKILPDETDESFRLFVSASPLIACVKSIAYSELGEFERAQLCCDLSLDFYRKTKSRITKLFIASHTGYAMSLLGQHEKAFPYLNEAAEICSDLNANLLAPECLSLLASSYMHLGNPDQGKSYMEEAVFTMNKTAQGHKRGLVNYLFLESLLVQYDLESFSALFKQKIVEAKKLEQLPQVAWMYFLEAVFYAFYKRSVKGYIGALAKANMIATSLSMHTLVQNIISLSQLEHTQILRMGETHDNTTGPFFDKALYFFELTHNTTSLHLHKLN